MKVLVVDDNEDIRLLVRFTLRSAGIDAVLVDGGAEALRLLDAGLVTDLVLLDVQMPQMDGWETLEGIRRRDNRVPVVLCTVKSSLGDRERGWRLGCDGYLTKPFDIDELTTIVQRVHARTPDERVAVRSEALEEVRRMAEST